MANTNSKLKGWMGAHDISGTKMAEKIGMPYETFKHKLAGKSSWKLSEVKALLEFTGCTFEELF